MTLRLSTYKTIWPLAAPFRITGKVFEETETLTVEVSDGDHIGRGESVGVFYLGDNAPRMIEIIESVRGEIEAGISIDAVQELLPPCGARNALDCALWDLETKRSKKSIWALTGIVPKSIQTVYTIGIEATAAEMATNAERAKAYPFLKIKLDSEEPVAKIEAIRAARPDAVLVIDANQGFDFSQLKGVLPEFERLGVSMLEQPLPRGADQVLEVFHSPIPLCADESCLNLAELPSALSKYDMINIKLDKCGGLTEALKMARQAREAGKQVMVGNMMGTSLSMSPSYVLAQLCDIVDLDGPLGLKSDYLDGFGYDGPNMVPPGKLWGRLRE
ncbi:MAG: dipeptide epimerase [Parvibaculaceae bacterium]